MPWSLRSAPMFGWVMAGPYVFPGHSSGHDE
jgi:hypothetical protein